MQGRRQSGFSLLEVLVAFAILAGSLGVLMQALSTGLRNASLAERYAEAVSLAQSKLAEIAITPELEAGAADEGEWEEGFRYRWSVTTYDMELPDPPPPVEPLLIALTVSWQEGEAEREVALRTLHLQPSAGAGMAPSSERPRRAIRQ